MPLYTFAIVPRANSEPLAEVQKLENDEVAIHVARRLLGPKHRAIRVGRGDGDAVRWLGAWRGGLSEVSWVAED